MPRFAECRESLLYVQSPPVAVQEQLDTSRYLDKSHRMGSAIEWDTGQPYRAIGCGGMEGSEGSPYCLVRIQFEPVVPARKSDSRKSWHQLRQQLSIGYSLEALHLNFNLSGSQHDIGSEKLQQPAFRHPCCGQRSSCYIVGLPFIRTLSSDWLQRPFTDLQPA